MAFLTFAGLYCLGAALPVAGWVAWLVSPIPIAVSTAKRGWGVGFITATAAVALLAAIGYPFSPLPLALMGWMMGIFVHSRWRFSRIIVTSTVLLFASALAVPWILTSNYSLVPQDDPTGAIEHVMAGNGQLFGADRVDALELKQLREQVLASWKLAREIYPALLLCSCFVLACFISQATRMALGTSGDQYLKVSPFGELRLPHWIVWFFIAGWLGVVMIHQDRLHQTRLFAENVLAITLAVYILQGLAIARHFFVKWKTNYMAQCGMYFLTAVVFPMTLCVVSLGLMDTWFDFRTRADRPKAPKEIDPDEDEY